VSDQNNALLDRLPHTGQARLPQRILHLEPAARVAGERRLAPGDSCLNGSGFLPSSLLVELMAQVGGVLLVDPQEPAGGYAMLAGIKRMHLHGTAAAGETVLVECSLVRRLGDLYLLECRSRAAGRDLAHGTMQIRRVAGGPR